MTSWAAVKGDVNDKRLIGCKGGVDNFLTATAAEGHAIRGLLKHTLDGTVTDPTSKVVQIDFSDLVGQTDCHDGSDAKWTLWRFEIEVTFDDGSKVTWPEADEPPDNIKVRLPYN
jgi:hypothetical protein